MLLALEICLTAIAVALADVVPELGAKWFEKWERSFGQFARRRTLALVSVSLIALAARAALLPILPVPEPPIHDEFSHLLLADTLAHGRLANPTHSMWVHFETFHVNFHPTYASMYYPGQAIFLAAGQVIFGHPFWGVWLSVGLMCGAICWMLQGWLPPGWALLGGLLAGMRLALFSYWANTYFGGAVAAIGGALVLGALPRIKRRQRVSDAVAMAAGLALLANTRPYESLFFCVPIAVALFVWMTGKKGPPLRRLMRRLLLPMGLSLAIAFGAMSYYFWRVTGSPFRIPYQVNIATYHLVYFPWQKLDPTAKYNHDVMREFYQGAPVAGQYGLAHLHPVRSLLLKPAPFWLFYLGPALTLPFFAWFAIRVHGRFRWPMSRKSRFLLLVCGATFVGLALPIYLPPAHYSAALTAAVYALLLQALRSMRLWRPNGQPTGRFLVRAVLIICFVLLPLRAAAPLLHIQLSPTVIHTWYSTDFHNIDRARLLGDLEKNQEKQLVIVRYRPDHEILEEWVYNGADIDGSKVVWARDMGGAKNRELIDYFKDRRVWLVQPDEKPVRVTPYAQDVPSAGGATESRNRGLQNRDYVPPGTLSWAKSLVITVPVLGSAEEIVGARWQFQARLRSECFRV
jgi:hypothetical protein